MAIVPGELGAPGTSTMRNHRAPNLGQIGGGHLVDQPILGLESGGSPERGAQMTDLTAQLQHAIAEEDARPGRNRVVGWGIAIVISAGFWGGLIWGVVAVVQAVA